MEAYGIKKISLSDLMEEGLEREKLLEDFEVTSEILKEEHDTVLADKQQVFYISMCNQDKYFAEDAETPFKEMILHNINRMHKFAKVFAIPELGIVNGPKFVKDEDIFYDQVQIKD